jgi:hypothetical protein
MEITGQLRKRVTSGKTTSNGQKRNGHSILNISVTSLLIDDGERKIDWAAKTEFFHLTLQEESLTMTS